MAAASCSYSSWIATGTCFVKLPLPDLDLSLTLAMQKCSGEVIPQISLNCDGAGCQSLMLPCSSNNQCGNNNCYATNQDGSNLAQEAFNWLWVRSNSVLPFTNQNLPCLRTRASSTRPSTTTRPTAPSKALPSISCPRAPPMTLSRVSSRTFSRTPTLTAPWSIRPFAASTASLTLVPSFFRSFVRSFIADPPHSPAAAQEGPEACLGEFDPNNWLVNQDYDSSKPRKCWQSPSSPYQTTLQQRVLQSWNGVLTDGSNALSFPGLPNLPNAPSTSTTER